MGGGDGQSVVQYSFFRDCYGSLDRISVSIFGGGGLKQGSVRGFVMEVQSLKPRYFSFSFSFSLIWIRRCNDTDRNGPGDGESFEDNNAKCITDEGPLLFVTQRGGTQSALLLVPIASG